MAMGPGAVETILGTIDPKPEVRQEALNDAQRAHADQVATAIEDLYRVFATYERPADISFCGLCYTDKEREYFQKTPLRGIEPDMARQLLWESSDHWETPDVYKHFLPRILEVLGPAIGMEDAYPEHLRDVLTMQEFLKWDEREKVAVRSFLKLIGMPLPGDAHWFDSARTTTPNPFSPRETPTEPS